MRLIEHIRLNIPVKILLAILGIEVVLLMVMGIFYSSRFNREIDSRISDKLALPGVLMNQRAMPYDKVKDLRALSDLVQEKVVDAFIFGRGGKIFFNVEPSREGRVFTDFLLKEEEGVFDLDMDQARQYAFVDGSGAHYISNVTPLTANGTLLGGLYVRISADAIKERKMGIILFFCLGAALAIILTTLISAFLVHRMVVPRIIEASWILKRYTAGDFTARIVNPGVPDQLGELMRQVNTLLEEIEDYTRKLQALNLAAEKFSRADDREEVFQIAVAKIEENLPVRRKQDEQEATCLLTLPVNNLSSVADGSSIQFVAQTDGRQLSPGEAGFVQALSGLMESALERIEAFQRISEAEEKYRDLFVSALEGIYRARLDGTLIEINPALAAMMGFDSVADMFALSGNMGERYVSAEDRQELLRQLLQVEKIQEYEVPLLRRDGSVFQAAMSARLVRDKSGTTPLIEGRVVDISERSQRQREEQERLAADAATKARLLLVEDLEHKNRQLHAALDELKNMQQQLVQSEKMAAVGMTAGGVAHDLNNILAGVISYPELLLATMPADSPFREPLEAILASGRRAAAVVADLLTLAKGSARMKQDVMLHSLVEEYLGSAEFQAMMRLHPAVQVGMVDASDNDLINCSPVHIQKVIMNLVMNAVEAVAAGGGSVVVRTSRQDPDQAGDLVDGSLAVLEVCDDGPGIPEENRAHIFEPFYTRKVMGKKGTGLGLTVVWNVVKEHGGRLELDSGANGTTFRVFLPAAEGQGSDDFLVDDTVDLQGRGTILVVDDERLQRDIATKMLTTFGYEVLTAASGQAAIDLLRRRPVDLVVLDMLMPPGMNGLQTYRGIIALHPGQKALIVSGFSESRDVKAAMQLGVGGFVKKPYTMNQFARAIKTEMERPPAAA